MMRHPYVFKVKGGTEFRAADRLLRFGVIAANPCVYKFVRKHKDGPAILEARAQLSGYFAGFFDPAKFWQVMNAKFDDGSRVLGNPLSTDGMLRPLPDHIWREIMDLNSYSAEAPQVEMGRGLRPGMTVVLRHGQHAGARFTLQEVSANGKKAKAITQMFGTLREVTISAENVEVVAA